MRSSIQHPLIEHSFLFKSDDIHSFEEFLSVFSAYCFQRLLLMETLLLLSYQHSTITTEPAFPIVDDSLDTIYALYSAVTIQ